MMTTDKIYCLMVADALAGAGVTDVVLCPGSRNAPLSVALSRDGRFVTHVVIDERSAAFIALGLAVASGSPAAVVCTSGSALLNVAPAVAEAYYRHVPLAVVSADRPVEWIDQDDSQTIRQAGALQSVVKEWFDVPVEHGSRLERRYVGRRLNDVMRSMVSGCRGPVHVNVQIDEPLDGMAQAEAPLMSPDIATVAADVTAAIPRRQLHELARQVATARRVMVIAGFHAPDSRLQAALRSLASMSNVAVLCEAQSNLHGREFVDRIDATLSVLDRSQMEAMRPDLVITLGGSLVSRMIKTWLRSIEGLRHWHVGLQPKAVDCFLALERRIEADPAVFMGLLARAVLSEARGVTPPSGYAAQWHEAAARACAKVNAFASEAPWCDFKAMHMLLKAMPRRWNLQLSNGTAVRYAQLSGTRGVHRTDCNRGVSGIDGCTSTAIGASWAYSGVTMLVSGDMSAQYDMGALATAGIDARFKMVVLDNGGGGIFRFIRSTRALPELERCFVTDVRLPLRQLADGFGFAYFEASSADSFAQAFRAFAAESSRPAILRLITDGALSAQVLTDFFNHT